MTLAEARNVVYARKSELEDELADSPTPYEKRLILLNLNACSEMLLYLDMLSKGLKPTFSIHTDYVPIIKKEVLA